MCKFGNILVLVSESTKGARHVRWCVACCGSVSFCFGVLYDRDLTGNLELSPGMDVDVKDVQNNWLPGKVSALQGSSVSTSHPLALTRCGGTPAPSCHVGRHFW